MKKPDTPSGTLLETQAQSVGDAPPVDSDAALLETQAQSVGDAPPVDSDAESEGTLVDTGESSSIRLAEAMAPLAEALSQRFRKMAPAAAASVHTAYISSAHFKNVVSRECAAVNADFSSFNTLVECVEWLGMLVD